MNNTCDYIVDTVDYCSITAEHIYTHTLPGRKIKTVRLSWTMEKEM